MHLDPHPQFRYLLYSYVDRVKLISYISSFSTVLKNMKIIMNF